MKMVCHGKVSLISIPDLPVARITYRLHLPPTPSHTPNILSTLALIKSAPTLDSINPLATQLHFVLLSSASPQLIADDDSSGPTTTVSTPTPYDGLHSLVHWGVAPWFDSYVSSKQGLLDGPAVKKGEAQMGKSHHGQADFRDPRGEEEIRRAGVVVITSKAECGNT
jgi:hypothetical protein